MALDRSRWDRERLPGAMKTAPLLLAALLSTPVMLPSSAADRGAAETEVPGIEFEFPRHHFTVFVGGATHFSDEEEGEAEGETTTAEGRRARHDGGGTSVAAAHEAAEESAPGMGVEYEYRFNRWIGAGALVEGVFGGVRESIILVPVSLHPWRGLRLTAAPGVDFHLNDAEFAFRVGAGYEIELGRGLTLAPEVAGDFTRVGKTLVYGLSLGWGF